MESRSSPVAPEPILRWPYPPCAWCGQPLLFLERSLGGLCVIHFIEEYLVPEETPVVEDKLVGAAAKLAYIQTHVTNVSKSGWNDHHKFHFIQEHGMFEVLRPLLREVGLCVLASPAEEVTVDGGMVTLRGKITLIDTDPGCPPDLRSLEAWFVGQGKDSQDKGGFKAQTGWEKYALQKLCWIPTEAIDDTDQGADVKDEQPARSGAAPVQEPDMPFEPAIGHDKAVQMQKELAEAIQAGGLDANLLKAKLGTLGHGWETMAQMPPSRAAELEAWVVEQGSA